MEDQPGPSGITRNVREEDSDSASSVEIIGGQIVLPEYVVSTEEDSKSNSTSLQEISEEIEDPSVDDPHREAGPTDSVEQQKKSTCTDCGKTFFSKRSFEKHSRKHKADRIYNCFHCDLKFGSRYTFDSHIAEITKNPFDCTQCNERFFRQSALEEHVRTVHAEVSYDCTQCSSKFIEESIFEEHMRMHAVEREKPFVCTYSYCNVRFKLQCYLDIHLRKHADGKESFSCSFCEFKCAKSTRLLSHLVRVHHVKDNYVCSQCKARFTSQRSLHRHELHIHSTGSVSRLACTKCTATFSTNDHLVNHVRSFHSGKRPYRCRYCTSTFATPSNLNSHERSHTKPVICTVCNTKFARGFKLKEHFRAYHPDKTLRMCPKRGCFAGFAEEDALAEHIRCSHNDN